MSFECLVVLWLYSSKSEIMRVSCATCFKVGLGTEGHQDTEVQWTHLRFWKVESGRREWGLGLLFSMGKPTVVANQAAWRPAPSQCQDALLGSCFFLFSWETGACISVWGSNTRREWKSRKTKGSFPCCCVCLPKVLIAKGCFGSQLAGKGCRLQVREELSSGSRIHAIFSCRRCSLNNFFFLSQK